MKSQLRLAALGCLLAFGAGTAAHAALSEGQLAPVFKAEAALAGKEFTFDLEASLEKGPVVLYFYPSAYTNGCNVQARTFAVNHDRFVAAGATIIGVSLDSIERLKQFSADPDYCAGKFATVSDADGRIARSFDLQITELAGMKDTLGRELDHGFAERTTFIITSDRRIAATVGGVNPKENVEKTLQIVQQLGRTSSGS
jgi:peroxiredoxin Q/BCP